MAGSKDIHLNPSSFNSDYTRDVSSATKGYRLSKNQFNAVKHAGVSAVLTDVAGGTAANIFGHGVEFVQDMKGFFDPKNVSDDAKDLTNNAIGREYARRNPGKTAEEYYRAMAALAQSGNLVEDPKFTHPVFPSGRAHGNKFQKYMDDLVKKALRPDVMGLFSKPVEAKSPKDLNGPEGKIYALPRSSQFTSRARGDSNPVDDNNPFNLEKPDLKLQAALLDQSPALAERLIIFAGRDPRYFGL